MTKMCPFLVSAQGSAACHGKNCAWFVTHESPKAEECAIKELSDNLKFISMKIAEKL